VLSEFPRFGLWDENLAISQNIGAKTITFMAATNPKPTKMSAAAAME
jgi:hypothetical protein